MSNNAIFINCPFDEAYRGCFESILFIVTMSGYQARCALEENDSGDVRFDKLCDLIRESDRTLHDLSRTISGPDGLPRFNMPFELGLMMGAKRFGGKRQREKRALIMVAERFAMPRFLSDLAGNDPAAHSNDPREVIKVVRDHLHTGPTGVTLPGAKHMNDLFDQFQNDLPKLAAKARLTLDEVHPYHGYRNFMNVLGGFRDMIAEIAD
jgi:hypothetical protein